jgi:predicted amidophosphoribosyltransferase
VSGKVKLCPLCNYAGDDGDKVCPHCGVALISECPQCGARIKTAFAEYCYACGINFREITKNKEEV